MFCRLHLDTQHHTLLDISHCYWNTGGRLDSVHKFHCIHLHMIPIHILKHEQKKSTIILMLCASNNIKSSSKYYKRNIKIKCIHMLKTNRDINITITYIYIQLEGILNNPFSIKLVLYLWDIVDWLFGLIKFNRNKLYDKTIWIASSFN